jgi:hypothetical protein
MHIKHAAKPSIDHHELPLPRKNPLPLSISSYIAHFGGVEKWRGDL